MDIESGDVRLLRYRLSPHPPLPLSQQRLSDFLGVSWSTVARWEGGGRVNVRLTRKLVRVQRVLDVLGDQIKLEHRLAFFTQQHPLLLGLRPIDLLESEEGLAAVLRQIEGG